MSKFIHGGIKRHELYLSNTKGRHNIEVRRFDYAKTNMILKNMNKRHKLKTRVVKRISFFFFFFFFDKKEKRISFLKNTQSQRRKYGDFLEK